MARFVVTIRWWRILYWSHTRNAYNHDREHDYQHIPRPTYFIVSNIRLLSGCRDIFLLRYHLSATTNYNYWPKYDSAPISLPAAEYWIKRSFTIRVWSGIFVKYRRLYVSWYKVENFGQKTLLLGFAPLVAPSHFVERALQGLGIMEGRQVGQRFRTYYA